MPFEKLRHREAALFAANRRFYASLSTADTGAVHIGEIRMESGEVLPGHRVGYLTEEQAMQAARESVEDWVSSNA